MAVLKCPECGGKVSDQAASCPHCGVKLGQCPECGGVIKYGASQCPHCGIYLEWGTPQQTTKLEYHKKEKDWNERHPVLSGCLGIIIVGAIISFCVDTCGGDSGDRKKKDDSNAAKVEQTEESKAEEEEYSVKYTFEDLIKQNLRDPDSYQFVDMKLVKTNGNEKMYTIRYRAKNGFGGYNNAEALVSSDGKELTIISNGDD